MTRADRPTGARASAVAHLLAGTALLVAPRRLLRAGDSGDAAPTSAVALTRLLAGQHLTEGVWLVRTSSPSAQVRAAWAEGVHIASMALWRPSDPALRAFAVRGAALSVAFLAAHAAVGVLSGDPA